MDVFWNQHHHQIWPPLRADSTMVTHKTTRPQETCQFSKQMIQWFIIMFTLRGTTRCKQSWIYTCTYKYIYIYICLSIYLSIYACMYVCMYVCMHLFCKHVCRYVCRYVCMHACMHVCMYVCTYANANAMVHAFVYAYAYVYVYAYAYVYVYVYVHVSVHVYVNKNVYVYVCANIFGSAYSNAILCAQYLTKSLYIVPLGHQLWQSPVLRIFLSKLPCHVPESSHGVVALAGPQDKPHPNAVSSSHTAPISAPYRSMW